MNTVLAESLNEPGQDDPFGRAAATSRGMKLLKTTALPILAVRAVPGKHAKSTQGAPTPPAMISLSALSISFSVLNFNAADVPAVIKSQTDKQSVRDDLLTGEIKSRHESAARF